MSPRQPGRSGWPASLACVGWFVAAPLVALGAPNPFPYVYVSPVPGSQLVSPQNNVLTYG